MFKPDLEDWLESLTESALSDFWVEYCKKKGIRDIKEYDFWAWMECRFADYLDSRKPDRND